MRPDSEDNGLLKRMSAEEIGAALMRLPDAASCHADEIQQWSTTPTLGGVLLTFKRHRHSKGKSSLVFWVAVRAERADSTN